MQFIKHLLKSDFRNRRVSQAVQFVELIHLEQFLIELLHNSQNLFY